MAYTRFFRVLNDASMYFNQTIGITASDTVSENFRALIEDRIGSCDASEIPISESFKTLCFIGEKLNECIGQLNGFQIYTCDSNSMPLLNCTRNEIEGFYGTRFSVCDTKDPDPDTTPNSQYVIAGLAAAGLLSIAP